MHILEGLSENHDAGIAVCEATGHWPEHASPDIVFVFHSSEQHAASVAAHLSDRFPDTIITGCSTAGEWLTGQHRNGSLVLMGLTTPSIRWAVRVLENLNGVLAESAKSVCDDLLQQLDVDWKNLNAENFFCLSFFDGLSKREEPVIAAMAAELGDIPLLGGSAGDDLKFEDAFVIANGKAYQHAAVFVMADCKLPFRAIKHQHFIPGDIDVVITKADVANRIVYRLDGMPAAQRYAQLLGLDVADLTPHIFSHHPLIYPYANECYVRALRQVCHDDGLEFGCAIEEGMVLNLCQHQDMSLSYQQLMTELKQSMGEIQLLLACNCIYRALEGNSENINQQLAEHTGTVAEHMIGFDTYGEQWQGLHVNQSLVALVLGKE